MFYINIILNVERPLYPLELSYAFTIWHGLQRY